MRVLMAKVEAERETRGVKMDAILVRKKKKKSD